jgi:isopropylmalate/homocitrate/citramalate synthase
MITVAVQAGAATINIPDTVGFTTPEDVDRLETLGHPLEGNQLGEVYARFTELVERKKSIYDQDLLGLLQPGKSIPVATV